MKKGPSAFRSLFVVFLVLAGCTHLPDQPMDMAERDNFGHNRDRFSHLRPMHPGPGTKMGDRSQTRWGFGIKGR